MSRISAGIPIDTIVLKTLGKNKQSWFNQQVHSTMKLVN